MTDTWTAAQWESFFDQRERARLAYDRMRCAQLSGNDALVAAVQDQWEPIRHFQRSHNDYERQREDDLLNCGIVN